MDPNKKQQPLYGNQNMIGPRYAHVDRGPDGQTAFGPPVPAGHIPRPITSTNDATYDQMYRDLQKEQKARTEFLARPTSRQPLGSQMHIPNLEDINSAYINESETAERAIEPIYRCLRFNACSKYANSPSTSRSMLEWPITANVAQAGTIVVNDAYLQAIVSVSLNPFYVPGTMFTHNDFFYGYIQVRINTFPTSELSCYDYFGSTTQPQVALYHFDCTGTYDATTSRWFLTPTPSKMTFAFPTPISNTTWRVSFRSPFSGTNTPIPPTLGSGVIIPSNPMTINSIGHGLSTGYYVTIDNTTPIPNLNYTQYVGIYIVTVVDSNQFTINLDATQTQSSAPVSMVFSVVGRNPSPNLTGTIAATNPIQITLPAHDLVTGQVININNTPPINGLTYTPYSGQYAVTVTGPNTFTLALDGTSVQQQYAPITYGIATNDIRMHFEVTALDKTADIISSNRAILTN
jgi:hypothetical protein